MLVKENPDSKKNVIYSLIDSFVKYYMPLVEFKDFNALIDNKSFFDQSMKSKEKAYEKHVKMSRTNNYTSGNSVDYLYHHNYYKFIGIDLSRQKNSSILQQINLIGKLEKDDGATMFFIVEKQPKLF